MKTIKTILILCVALCFATSCKKEVDMTLVQKTLFENANISQVYVFDSWEVTIVADDRSYVELEYSAYLEPGLQVEIENSRLEIGFTSNVNPVPGSVFKATVHTTEKEFLAVRAENSSVITMEGPFELENSIDIELIDASVCSGFKVSAESCSILATNASQLLSVDYQGKNCVLLVTKSSSCKGSFNVENSFNASALISSQIIVFGGAMPSASIEVKEEGTINMVQAEVNDMKVHLEGASEATVNVTETIRGFILSSSTLYYKGHPQIDVDCSEDSQLIHF